MPGRLLARGHRQQAVGVDLERHPDARRARDHRRNAAQLEARERAAIGDLLALALHDVDRHRGLAVLERRELLRARDGIVELRGMIFSASPPIVSRPSDSGITSSSSQSSSRSRLPASLLAWIAAPSATTSSGLRLVSGGWPKNSATARRTCGMRVAPPTSTTPLMSAGASRASRNARLTGCSVLPTRCAVISVNVVGVERQRRPGRRRTASRRSARRRGRSAFSFASRALTSSSRASAGDSGGSFACLDAPSRTRDGRSRRRRAPNRRWWRAPRTRRATAAGSRCRTCRRRGRRRRRCLRAALSRP